MTTAHTITVPGRYDQIAPICNFVAHVAEEAGFNEDAICHVQLACDEACTNVIEHAYGQEDAGEIKVSCRLESDALIVTIQDHGRPFDPDHIAPPHIPAGDAELGQLRVGGLGLHFMRRLMDEVIFSFDQGGNTLIMVKRLSDEGEG